MTAILLGRGITEVYSTKKNCLTHKAEHMMIILFGVIVLAVAATNITRYAGLETWQVSIALLVLAGALYFLNTLLIQVFIKKRAPDIASSEEVIPGLQKWDLTAGVGVVPKWVSWIGLLAISALFTAAVPWVVEVFKLSMR